MGTHDRIGGSIFVALGVLILILTLHFPSLDDGHPGPSLFPRILAVLFIFFGGIVFWRGWKGTGKKGGESSGEAVPGVPRNYLNPILVLVGIGAYMFLADWLGFFITSSLLLFLLMKKLQVPIWRNLIFAPLLSFLINLLFYKVLRVPLPIFWTELF